jgi:uncharacterized damage-inducible protein DinB
MVNLPVIRELFAFNDWARDQLLARAEVLDDATLVRPFEMGEGSLGKTLRHLWGAEYRWLKRWQSLEFGAKAGDVERDPLPIASLRERWMATGRERDAYLDTLGPADVPRPVTYKNYTGELLTFPLGDLLLHTCNHGTHHRAQAVNMLRHLGAPPIKPGLDYIFWRLQLGEAAPPAVTVEAMQTYCRYSDWAERRVLAIARELSDAQLDRRFELGIGTLRGTLLHIRFAEQWWVENWTTGPGKPFPELPPDTPVTEIARLTDETFAARDEFLRGLKDADLAGIVEAHPRPGVVRRFPMCVTMLQLCSHGTHHRAQALNMLRHVGATVPGLDYLVMFMP